MGLIASILLELAAASPFRADAQDIFGGCHASQNGPNGRFYGCPDWNSSIGAFPGETYVRARAIVMTRSAMRGALQGPLREEGEIMLGGTDTTVLVFVPADEADPKSFGFALATMLPSPSGMRLLTCVSRTDGKVQRDRCRRALEYLATHGAPDGAEISAPAPIGKAAIGDRALDVPAGCRVAAANEVAGRLQCESSFLSWNTIEKRGVPSTTRWLEEAIPSFTAAAGGGFSDERIPCRVETVPARCARLTKEVPSKGTFRLYVGTAVVKDHAVMIACGFFDLGQGFAPVCNHTLLLP